MVNQFDEIRLSQMVHFGFTELQARVYVANYVLGEASAKQIREICKMHKAEVYRVLKELQDMRITDQIIAHPVRYRARCPAEVLKSLLLPSIRKMSALSDTKGELLEWFGTLRPAENVWKQDGDGFEVLHDHLAVERVKDMFLRASSYIYYSGRYEDKARLEVIDTFNKAVDRGVSVKSVLGGVTEQDADILKQMKWSNRVSRRRSDKVYSWTVIVDGKEALFGSAPTVLPGEEFLYTRNQRYIAHLTRIFEILWGNSSPLGESILAKEVPVRSRADRKGCAVQFKSTSSIISDQ
ncbi:MAG: hypothetical protein HYY22_00385 [Thaumarchaeota archaeon]|nr:hypothetical protein [Nitrososphaerota archaeon]